MKSPAESSGWLDFAGTVLVLGLIVFSLPATAEERKTITIEGVDRRQPRSAYHYPVENDTVSYNRLLATGDMPYTDTGTLRPVYRPLGDSRPLNKFFPHGVSSGENTAVTEYGATEFFLISSGVAVLLFLSL